VFDRLQDVFHGCTKEGIEVKRPLFTSLHGVRIAQRMLCLFVQQSYEFASNLGSMLSVPPT
jgi:hypothetical protein